MNRSLSHVVCALGACLLAAGPVLAQAKARVYGVVSDPRGEPLEGVKITVTDPEVESFRLQVATDKKGKFSVLLVDSTRPYLYHLEKQGYYPVEELFKAAHQSNTEKDFVLRPAEAGAPSPPGGAPGEAIALFNEGAAAAARGELESARQKFEAALELDPGLAAAHAALAGVLLRQGRHAEAAAAAERTLALDPGNEHAPKIRYEAYRALGDEVKAEEARAALAAVDPRLAAADLYRQGAEAYNAGRMDVARDLLERAVAADPGRARAHYLLGLCYLNAGQNAEAKAAIEKFLELAPDDPDAATAREMLGYLR